MATRSNIGIMLEDGTIKAIYCHWDGYPEGVGKTLATHYSERNKVLELINLGDISSLAETIEETAKTASPNDSERVARTFNDVDEWRNYASEQWAEYLYIYRYPLFNNPGFEWSYLQVNNYWTPIAGAKQEQQRA